MLENSHSILHRYFHVLIIGIGLASAAALLTVLHMLTASFDRHFNDIGDVSLRATAAITKEDKTVFSSPVTQNVPGDGDLAGSQFYKDALPWVLTLCTSIVLLTMWASYYVRHLVTSLGQVRKVATTDQLTGVPNLTALIELLRKNPLDNALKEGGVAAVSLDLDDFKQLNDKFGHSVGNVALQVAANRIERSLRRSDRVFRLGGDEFICLIFDPDAEGAAKRVVDRLKQEFSSPMVLATEREVVTPSIGVAVAGFGESWDAILDRSDAAMYRAKRGGNVHSICPRSNQPAEPMRKRDAAGMVT